MKKPGASSPKKHKPSHGPSAAALAQMAQLASAPVPSPGPDPSQPQPVMAGGGGMQAPPMDQ